MLAEVVNECLIAEYFNTMSVTSGPYMCSSIESIPINSPNKQHLLEKVSI